MSSKVYLIVVLVVFVQCTTFTVHAEEVSPSPSKTGDSVPVPAVVVQTKDKAVDPGFTFSTTTAKSENNEVPCIRIYNPVCASDGRTYNSKCELGNAQRKDPKLTLVKEGEC